MSKEDFKDQFEDFLLHLAFLYDGFQAHADVAKDDADTLYSIAEQSDWFDVMAAIESCDKDRLVDAIIEQMTPNDKKMFERMIRSLNWFPKKAESIQEATQQESNELTDEETRNFLKAVSQLAGMMVDTKMSKDDIDQILDEVLSEVK